MTRLALLRVGVIDLQVDGLEDDDADLTIYRCCVVCDYERSSSFKREDFETLLAGRVELAGTLSAYEDRAHVETAHPEVGV